MLKIRKDFISGLFSFAVLFYPIMLDYKYLGVTSIANILLALICAISIPYFLYKRKVKLYAYESTFLAYWIYALLITIIYSGLKIDKKFSFADFVHILVFIGIVILFQSALFDFRYAVRYFIIIGIVLTIVIYVQFILYEVYGIQWRLVPGVYRINEYRPSSFFLEPSHYVNYCVFILVILIFLYENSKLSLIISLFISGGMALSSSSTGLIYLIFLWGIWVVKNFKRNKIFKYAKRIIFLIGIIFILLQTRIFEFSFEHLKETSLYSLSSGGQRIFRGFTIYNSLSSIEQIIGIGFNLHEYMLEKRIFTIFDGGISLDSLDYVSGFSYILIAGGIFGFLIYLIYCICYWRKADYIAKMLLFMYLLFILSNEAIYSGISLLMQLLMFAYMRQGKVLKPEIVKHSYKNS